MIHEKRISEVTFADLSTCRVLVKLPAHFIPLHARSLYDDSRKNWVIKMKILHEADGPYEEVELFLTDNLNWPLGALRPGEDAEHLTSVEAWGNGSVVHIFQVIPPYPVSAPEIQEEASNPAPQPPPTKKIPIKKAKAKA